MGIKIEYAEMPPSLLRGNSRGTWRQKLKPKQVWEDKTLIRIREQNFKPIQGKAELQYTAYYCGTAIDNDNLVIGMKCALDMFTREGLIKDDGPDYIGILPVIYHRVPHRNQVRLVMEIKQKDEEIKRLEREWDKIEKRECAK